MFFHTKMSRSSGIIYHRLKLVKFKMFKIAAGKNTVTTNLNILNFTKETTTIFQASIHKTFQISRKSKNGGEI